MPPRDLWELSFQYQPEYYWAYCNMLSDGMGLYVSELYEESEVEVSDWDQFVELDSDGESEILVDEVIGSDDSESEYGDEDNSVESWRLPFSTYYDEMNRVIICIDSDEDCDSDDETVTDDEFGHGF